MTTNGRTTEEKKTTGARLVSGRTGFFVVGLVLGALGVLLIPLVKTLLTIAVLAGLVLALAWYALRTPGDRSIVDSILDMVLGAMRLVETSLQKAFDFWATPEDR